MFTLVHLKRVNLFLKEFLLFSNLRPRLLPKLSGASKNGINFVDFHCSNVLSLFSHLRWAISLTLASLRLFGPERSSMNEQLSSDVLG